jgi:Leucine-rich repeat (LRR) protein
MEQVEQHCEDDDVKLKPGYLAHVSPTRLETAWALLQSKRSLNLHGFGPRKKITSLVPLGGMPSIERLFLAWNSIEDILPLASVPRLQSLSLKKNQVSDISAIASCRQLVDLDLSENPVQD